MAHGEKEGELGQKACPELTDSKSGSVRLGECTGRANRLYKGTRNHHFVPFPMSLLEAAEGSDGKGLAGL